MKEITNDLLRDLELILNSNDEYFIRWDKKACEVLACLHDDTIKVYDMCDPDDKDEFFTDLLKFLKKELHSLETCEDTYVPEWSKE